MNLSAGKILLLTLFLTVMAVAITVYISINQAGKVNRTFLQIENTQGVLYHSEKLRTAVTESQTLASEYAITGNKQYIASFDTANRSVHESFERLKNLTVENPQQQRKLDSLALDIATQQALSYSIVALRSSNTEAASLVAKEGGLKLHSERIYTLIDAVEQEARQALSYGQRINNYAITSLKTILYGVFGLLFILVVMLVQKFRVDVVTDKNVDAVTKYNALLMEHIQDAVISTDKDLQVVRWSKKAEEIFGWTAAEMTGKTIAAVLQPIYKDGNRASMLKYFLRNGTWEGEATLLKKNGHHVTLLLSSAMIGKSHGKMTGTVTIAKDISVLKQQEAQLKHFNLELGKQVEDRTSEIRHVLERLVGSEKKYKLLFENNPLPMWMIELPDMGITDVNDAALQKYGYSRRAFLQLNVKDLSPPEESDAFIDHMQQWSPGYHSAGVWRHRVNDDSIIFAEVFAYSMTLEDRNIRLILANDVTQKIEAEQKLKQSLEEIRMLSGHLQEVREEERKSIAREIHDELGQQLTVLKMDISWIGKKLKMPGDEISARLKELLETIDGTIKSVRRICSELRPTLLDDLGLMAAMEWHARIYENTSGIIVKLHRPGDAVDFAADIKTGLFRIYQESLTNVARHAEATEVDVNLNIDEGHILLTVADNGKGFDIAAADQKRTLGILGMKERCLMMGGKYIMTSQPGKGTTIKAMIPMNEKKSDQLINLSLKM